MVVQIGLYHIMSLVVHIGFIILCHCGCSDRSLSYYVTVVVLISRYHIMSLWLF